MDLIYPINFVGHDEWVASGYSPELAEGEVITRDGEVLGSWRVVEYDPETDDGGGRYEFVLWGGGRRKVLRKICISRSWIEPGIRIVNVG